MTLVVRAMALNEVSMRDIGWLVFKELRVGLVIGLFMAAVGIAQAVFLQVDNSIALVVALTLIAICIWSATVRRGPATKPSRHVAR